MKFLIFFLITLNSFANYIPKNKVGSCEIVEIFNKKRVCEKETSQICISISGDYNCKTDILVNNEVITSSDKLSEYESYKLSEQQTKDAEKAERIAIKGLVKNIQDKDVKRALKQIVKDLYKD